MGMKERCLLSGTGRFVFAGSPRAGFERPDLTGFQRGGGGARFAEDSS